VNIVASLRNEGYDVWHVLEDSAGSSDDDILRSAYQQNRILLTEDKDFGDLVYRLRKPAKGIIFIRIPIADRHLKWSRLKKLLSEFPERLPGHFVVLEKDKVRFRSLLFPL
jgi:predicted nuclease of predicted toxin-antitoxin system